MQAKSKVRATRQQREAVIDMARAGATKNIIATAVGLHPCHLGRILVHAGPLRPPAQPQRGWINVNAISDHDLKAKLELAIAELDLPLRIIGLLEQHGILYLHQLLSFSEGELRALGRINDKTIEAIYYALAAVGLRRQPERIPECLLR